MANNSEAHLDLTLECKGMVVKYGVDSDRWEYSLFDENGKHVISGTTCQKHAPIDFFKMIIYARQRIDFYRRSPHLTDTQVINSKSDIRQVPPGKLYFFEN